MTTFLERDPGRRAEAAVRAVLPRAAKVHMGEDDAGVDLVVNDHSFVIKWIGDGRLADAKRVVSTRRGRPDIAVARRMSPGARETLAGAGIGWVDETGAAEIAAGTIVISRPGRPPKPAGPPKRWTPSVIAVAEALLCGTKATVAAAEEATGLSNGSCTTALRVLTDFGLLVADAGRGRDSARRVADQDRLSRSKRVNESLEVSLRGCASSETPWGIASLPGSRFRRVNALSRSRTGSTSCRSTGCGDRSDKP